MVMSYMMGLVAKCIFQKDTNDVNCKIMDLKGMLAHQCACEYVVHLSGIQTKSRMIQNTTGHDPRREKDGQNPTQ